MLKRSPIQVIKKRIQGQGMVEFALVLPIMLFTIIGIIEFSRLIFIYIDVATAAREAARYGAAVGNNGNGSGLLYYQDCSGIRQAAERVGNLSGVTSDPGHVAIAWDINGVTSYDCETIKTVSLTGLTFGSTIDVTVSVPFQPLFFGHEILPMTVSAHAQRSFIANVYASN